MSATIGFWLCIAVSSFVHGFFCRSPSSCSTGSVVKEQIKLRDNALQQASILMDYKRAFCHYSASLTSSSSSSTREKPQRNGIFAIFVALLAEPLSRVGNARTDNDHLTIELIIYLFRNLLIAEPILNTSGTSTLRSSTSNTNDIHYELITIFDQELVLDILYVLCADIEQRENVSYNLLLMELIQLLFKHQNPIMIANSHTTDNSWTHQSRHHTSARPPLGTVAAPASTSHPNNSLLRSVQLEKQSIQSCSTSRHSHFGGTIVLENKSSGQKQLIGASLFNAQQSQSTALLSSNSNNSITQQQQLLLLSRRKNKNLEPFIGAKNHHTTTANALTHNNPYVSSWHKKSMQTLHRFCAIFVMDNKCYGPLMKSLKNEFRRDSVRLEDNDRIVYFQVVTFFCTWYRTNLKQQQQAAADAARVVDPSENDIGSDRNSVALPSSIGQLIFTMDVFSFNLVLNATDTFQEHKKYGPLSHSVALLREMMHLLHMMMQNSSTEPNQNVDVTVNATEQIMAMGLMDRLFYASEPLDRLPKLLSRWTPGTSTREYVCDLVEITHMTLQVLEANADLCRSGSTSENEDAMKHDTVAKMKATAIEFDIESYFVRKIVSNHTITMYTHLLSCYAINTLEVNQYVLSFFERVRQHVLSAPSDDIDGDEDDDDLVMKNPFTPKVVTMEPMLYNAQLFIVLNNILNDASIRSDSRYIGLINFASTIVNNFSEAAQRNPVLFVEVLFKHPSPHRFCDMITNCYVTEDLRMLVERDILLQQQYQLEQEVEAFANRKDGPEEETTPTNIMTSVNTGSARNNDDGNSESSDEELEFMDVPSEDVPILGKRGPKSANQHEDLSKRARTKSALSDSDDESE